MARSRCITWSPSVTLVPTRGCFNACSYCGFRRPLQSAELRADRLPVDALSDAAAAERLASRPAAREVLLLSGELPPQAPGRRAWFQRLERLSCLALAAGRLPHTNAGPLTLAEMARLARLNPSMGLMLEGLGPAYDALHRHAPSKTLAQRLGQLEQAGRLGIPFTTGLLLGVGESWRQRLDALELIALLQRSWGHIQEVILQPFRPPGLPPQPLNAAEQQDLLELIAAARAILPLEVHLQLPPNLWPLATLPDALEAGIDDLGGIDTEDVINPAYHQPTPLLLAQRLEQAGWRLQPRLCVHAAWIPRLPAALRRRVEALTPAPAGGC